jgi:hypothetical protein
LADVLVSCACRLLPLIVSSCNLCLTRLTMAGLRAGLFSWDIHMLIKGIEINEDLIDEVFAFLDDMTEEDYEPAHVVLAMLAVAQMIQDSSVGSRFLH